MRTFAILLSLLITCCPAFAEEAPDFSGVWKRDCEKSSGLKIWRNDDYQFSVAFCGPGGCGIPAFVPHTPIAGDPKFKVVSGAEIGLRRVDVADAWLMYHRCSRDPASSFETKPAEHLREAKSAPALQ
ncbi:hypothetical protein [Bradyrhizobium sp. OK095]|uniref:hypothetical protein n=1 Tax=Bradyrhizobium sp. OK095 TaxID=1882760 RepID=UPI0008AEF8E1|nr:hypothetical protein [Bradyrhizobium sp. OK095]SEM30647.1 hypothetical protein SAMN05443254_101695 [Bradyrhizobium sp. OK095]